MDPEAIVVLIPVVALLIPIVAILVKHQQKMAEIVHSRPQTSSIEVEALRREVHELKQLVHQQTIQVDSLITSQRQSIAPQQNLSQRLEQ